MAGRAVAGGRKRSTGPVYGGPCKRHGKWLSAQGVTGYAQALLAWETDADLGNLFPRVFRVLTGSYAYTVHLWWWKFASPVRDGETITVCGSRRDLPGRDPGQQLHQALAPDPQPV